MPDEPKPLPTSINFDYIKGNQFRVIHADGAFFAITPQAGLTISFFSDRQPIPRRVVHKVQPDGAIGDEILEQRVVRDAVVRDVDVTVTMNMETAKKMRETLDGIIKRLEEVKAALGQPK